VRHADVGRVKQLLDQAVAAASSPPASNAPSTAAVVDVAGQLAKLAELMKQNLLTPEEFEAQKRKLLG
jgi:hypothetical protein